MKKRTRIPCVLVIAGSVISDIRFDTSRVAVSLFDRSQKVLNQVSFEVKAEVMALLQKFVARTQCTRHLLSSMTRSFRELTRITGSAVSLPCFFFISWKIHESAKT